MIGHGPPTLPFCYVLLILFDAPENGRRDSRNFLSCLHGLYDVTIGVNVFFWRRSLNCSVFWSLTVCLLLLLGQLMNYRPLSLSHCVDLIPLGLDVISWVDCRILSHLWKIHLGSSCRDHLSMRLRFLGPNCRLGPEVLATKWLKLDSLVLLKRYLKGFKNFPIGLSPLLCFFFLPQNHVSFSLSERFTIGWDTFLFLFHLFIGVLAWLRCFFVSGLD